MSRQIKQEPDPGLPIPPPLRDEPMPSPGPSQSTSYTDFLLRSSAPSAQSGWKHNLMKFNALGSRTVDPADEGLFQRPVKLNRKDPRTVRRLTDEDRERHNLRAKERAAAIRGQGMDVDVKAEDGVKAEDEDAVKAEKEELDPDLVGKGANGAGLPNRRGPGGQFKKKTKRVYVSSEEARRLKREEWQPWVLEDDEGRERWIGRLEGGAGEVDSKGGNQGGGSAAQQGKVAQAGNGTGLQGWRPAASASDAGGGGSCYVAFVFGDNGDEFKVVPINRWYRFNQGPKYLTLAEEEAEEEYARQQKSKEPERWIMHRRAAPASSGSSTPRAASAGPSGTGSSANNAVSASALRSRMMANSALGSRLEPEEERGRSKIKTVVSAGGGGKKKRGGQDQDDDEFDYEEDFQDDEEGIAKIDDLADEEEAKELEERIRREQRAAERADEIPDLDEQEEIERLTGTGRQVKKLMKKADMSGAYESDDDNDNPYASSDEDSDSASVTSGSRDRPSSRAASPSAPSGMRSDSRSRAGTPSGSGSALVAKRATSPSGHSSRGASPNPSSGKRRREGDGGASDSDADGSKRRKAGANGKGKAKSPSPGAPVALLTEADLVAFFKTRSGTKAATKDVLTHFRKQIKGDERNKKAIGGLLQAVANLEGGLLVLKAGL
ncbi:transcription factor IIF subunit tfg1 [Rhodosporidiobolus nylandii]